MKILRVIMGSISGGLSSALCFGSLCWIVVYFSDPGLGTGTWGHVRWANLAAIVVGIAGLGDGVAVGLWLGLQHRGLIFGSLSGLVGGLVLSVLLSNGTASPDVPNFISPFLLAAFLPAGALSGFVTSLVLSQWDGEHERRGSTV